MCVCVYDRGTRLRDTTQYSYFSHAAEGDSASLEDTSYDRTRRANVEALVGSQAGERDRIESIVVAIEGRCYCRCHCRCFSMYLVWTLFLRVSRIILISSFQTYIPASFFFHTSAQNERKGPIT